MNTTARRLAVQPHAIAAALALAFVAGVSDAQSLVRPVIDGTSNTIFITERPRLGDLLPGAAGRLETRATLTGTVTQTQDSGARGAQVLAVGSVRDFSGTVGSLTTDASVTGNLTQSRPNAAGTSVSQTLDIGSVSGNLAAESITARATVTAPVSQTAGRALSDASQTVGIGSVSNATGGRFVADGTVSGGSITQDNTGRGPQVIGIGQIAGVNASSAEATGVVTGEVVQTQSSPSGVRRVGDQVLRVGAIERSQVQTASARGTLSASLTQTTRDGLRQHVDIGSIVDVPAGGAISTDAVVSGGAVVQRGGGGQGSEQTLRVGAVVGGSPLVATTRAALTGGVLQSNESAVGGDAQRVSIGSVEQSTGRATTDATVSAALEQSAGGGFTGGRKQEIAIGSVTRSGGTVATRATVAGRITQSMGSSAAQAVRIGSVSGLAGGSASTSVDVSGTIVQSTGSETGPQTIMIGSIGSSAVGGPDF